MKKDLDKIQVSVRAYIHPFYWAGFFMSKLGEKLFIAGMKVMTKYNVKINKIGVL